MRIATPTVRAASALLAAGLVSLALGTAPVHALSGDGVRAVNPGQGTSAPLVAQTGPAISRSEVLARAQSWVSLGLVYSGSGYYNGYRRDCSGYASMAWKLGTPGLDTTRFIPAGVAQRIDKNELRAGDALLNDAADRDGHIVLFDRWADAAHTSYVGYEFSGTGVHHRTIPYPYFPDYIKGNGYTPVRNTSVVDDATVPVEPTPAPSTSAPSAATLYNPDTATAEAFGINADGIMVHAYNTKGGPGWTPWESLDNSFRFTGSPTAVYNPV
ncbi:hypothetical protein WDV06_34355, partial [Streptomyces racemochromogenes]